MKNKSQSVPVTRGKLDPEDTFVRLCEIHKLRPVVVDCVAGWGIALDAKGQPYTRASTMRGFRQRKMERISMSEALTIINDEIHPADDVTSFDEGMKHFLKRAASMIECVETAARQ